MKALINTNLFPIISVGMYGSQLDPDYMFDEYLMKRDFEEGHIDFTVEEFWEGFDYDQYSKHIEELAQWFILNTSDELKEILPGLKIEAKELYSPKYYNYATDQIELEVEFDEEDVHELLKGRETEFNDYLKENYSSCSGFISHTPNNFFDWGEAFGEGNVQAIGAVLTFLFKDEVEEYHQGFYEYVNENTYYTEFYNEPKQ